jgi:geranylgeranyl pyrophosphate synthase
MITETLSKSTIESNLSLFANQMRDLLSSYLPSSKFRLVDAMRYSAISNGKYLRSFYLTEIIRTLSIEDNELTTLAAIAIEIIHTYSLIHDDLPAMDNDDLRRGKPTCHRQFDEATAILAGDSLLTFAFELLSDFRQEISIDSQIKIINIIAKAIGYEGMAGGQMLDIMYEKKDIEIEKIYQMQGMKTAELFRACGHIAAIIANVSEERCGNIMKFSYCFGLSFQIIDDILDEIADETVIGKKTKKDIQIGKARLVETFGIEGAKIKATHLIKIGLEFVANEPNLEFYQQISSYLLDRKH